MSPADRIDLVMRLQESVRVPNAELLELMQSTPVEFAGRYVRAVLRVVQGKYLRGAEPIVAMPANPRTCNSPATAESEMVP